VTLKFFAGMTIGARFYDSVGAGFGQRRSYTLMSPHVMFARNEKS
jgi:hypothetical protein